MTKIGIISDTHSFLDPAVFKYFDTCDEIWHAGDFGSIVVAEQLKAFKPLKGVYGNIDGKDLHYEYPEKLRFRCEGVDVLITHIGGYPGKYAPTIKNELLAHPPRLFVCGHSHILRIMHDDRLNCLYMNPGAAGNHGWHKVRTLIRFVIDGDRMQQCEVIELGKRG